jgi:hypothetical protein
MKIPLTVEQFNELYVYSYFQDMDTTVLFNTYLWYKKRVFMTVHSSPDFEPVSYKKFSYDTERECLVVEFKKKDYNIVPLKRVRVRMVDGELC